MPLLDRITSDLSIEQGHAIIASTSKPHDLVIEAAIQVFALKGLGGYCLVSLNLEGTSRARTAAHHLGFKQKLSNKYLHLPSHSKLFVGFVMECGEFSQEV